MRTVADVSFFPNRTFVTVGACNHTRHGQIVLAGEIQIALVMRRTAKNRAGAVVHEDEVGDHQRQGLIRLGRVLHAQAGVKTLLLLGFQLRFRRAGALALTDELSQLFVILCQLSGQGMFRGHAEERRTVNRIRTGGEDHQPVIPTFDGQRHFCAL